MSKIITVNRLDHYGKVSIITVNIDRTGKLFQGLRNFAVDEMKTTKKLPRSHSGSFCAGPRAEVNTFIECYNVTLRDIIDSTLSINVFSLTVWLTD